ncbi:hypothetical protein M409DRAFT_64550 [Zasmidium cellare ATCC 36951]|uniref:DNA helicase n=1 Tax=Zasmidium cellare ATCC 36951 TaxID=1080233 RepID=A0A6A6CXW8_ZASCE|nr:uncharacterized protein M409DRAFT_64550 [Zasmidium cellare ATCC 36951]KAF2170216.1 hypothetical protein M409DRAFT_64550 [Zasmidium cellare ATCC 36951]
MDDGTATTLRPAPAPSAKRRESEAALSTPEPSEKRPFKKRKRAASPPWQFPTAETTTLKTADGRRASARVNTGTPGVSEAEDSRPRSLSQSASRSRPPSPPWRKFEAEGPTSIQVDGKRKSGRVNKELSDAPKRVSPRSKKQVDKLGMVQNGDKKPANKNAAGNSKKIEAEVKKQALANEYDPLERPSTSSASAKRIAELQAQIAALQPTRSFPSPTPEAKPAHKRKATKDVPKESRSVSPPVHRKTKRMSNADQSPEKSKPSPKIKLRFNASRYTVPAPHPQAQIPSPPHPPKLNLHQLIEHFELKELQQPYMENDRGPPDADFFVQRAAKQAVEEAAMRQRLLKEAQPGGALSKDHLSLFQDDRQPEPPQQYSHHDHLVAHALYFRQLQQREKTQHKLLAKKLAYEAVEKWKTIHGPTEEDILAEEIKTFELIKKQVVADMKAMWQMVELHVQDRKKREWEAEQEKIRAEKLQKKLEYSENLLAKQRGDLDSDVDMDEDSTGDVEEPEESEDDVEENMTDSESGSSKADEDEGEMDEDALAAYLAQRQAEPPDKAAENAVHEDDDGDERMNDVEASELPTPSMENDAGENLDATPKPPVEDEENDVENDDDTTEHRRRSSRRGPGSESASPTREAAEVEDHLSSDESTDMDSEDYDSDEDTSSTGDEAEGGNDDDEDDETATEDQQASSKLRTSLLGFYTPQELLREKEGGLPTPMTSVENGGDNNTENARSGSEARSDDQANAESHADEDVGMDKKPDSEAVDEPYGKSLVPTPSLLRGTLRSYQQAGLDWLASLYRNGTNGILADEMGLGKTIQTIAVLAHLAEVYEVWETHLVIVPTSVILNWVTEFQKFLPGFRVLGYYGTADERAHKRRGWTNDPHHDNKEKRGYNVVITSYNVAMQDINAIRAVQWHYLILDEAHNIRNFNSQRWQVLIRLRTRARLLLTGTPLQNDLAELWSLLTFLTAGDDDQSQGALEEFLGHWKDPVKEIFDQGVQKISEEAQRVVGQLHISLRPFLLRRKKIEVEKDLPKKTESVVVCKLSKRQRQLYQDYMGLAETKATLAKGSGVQAGAVLLSLRRVCNHPDLFDPRPIQTSYAMEFSPLEVFGVKEQVVRRLLGVADSLPQKLLVSCHEERRRSTLQRSRRLNASAILQREAQTMEDALGDRNPDPSTLAGTRALQRLRRREGKLRQLRACIQVSDSALRDTPVYGSDLREVVTLHTDRTYIFKPRTPPTYTHMQSRLRLGRKPLRFEHMSDWHLAQTTQLQQDVATLESYGERLHETIVKFTFVPPAATVPILDYAIPKETQELLRSSPAYPVDSDFGHEARVRASIAFPDKRLLIYDSGKLQQLVHLLRNLQSRGSRSLIFTQMTGTLNVLEQFLNLLNLPYLRLDGSTPVERRQLYSAEFNRPDSKYQCMILSSRAGGVGLNLTGASSVIFYDLDWNPQMDRQCMDRAHRIGQVRDVEVYKMVSEKTVEENILRRANQKSLLDQTVIQEGQFTTEYQHPKKEEEEVEAGDDEVGVAIERFLGGEDKNKAKVLESIEDKEDVQAAQQAAKEDRQDDVDFADRSSKGASKANTPGVFGADEVDPIEEERNGHVDKYMIKSMEYLLKDWVYVPPPVRKLDKHGRDPSHRPKKRR